ncbi:hypothetical protein KAR91_01890 [Candidatus Pacearchaeota archaeon]|nr:hypothetical protein [Candidatus Pacearchaeota archaeon]
MPEINQLTAVDTVVDSDLVPIYANSNGDARKAAMSVILAYMQANLSFSESGISYTTQYAAPSATDFSVQVTDGSANIHLILMPVAGYADGEIVLPAVGNVVDKQEVLVNCTQAVTTLVVDGNGAVAVTGEPSGLSANDFFRLKYDLTVQSWYRVG